LTITWRHEDTAELFTKRIEIQSKESWIGMDVNTKDTGLVVCSHLDSKSSISKNNNPNAYPLALVLTLYDYKSSSLTKIFYSEFIDNKFQKASIMRRHYSEDIYVVGMIGGVSIFLLDSKGFHLMKSIMGFEHTRISDLYFGEKMLILVQDESRSPNKITYINFGHNNNDDDRVAVDMYDRSPIFQELERIYLQPNYKVHNLKRFRGELGKAGSFVQAVRWNGTDRLLIVSRLGISVMDKIHGGEFTEIGVHTDSSVAICSRINNEGLVIIHYAKANALSIFDPEVKADMLPLKIETSTMKLLDPYEYQTRCRDDEEFHIWFFTTTMFSIVELDYKDKKTRDLLIRINLNSYVSKDSMPISIVTNFESDCAMILYGYRGMGALSNQSLIVVNNIFKNYSVKVVAGPKISSNIKEFRSMDLTPSKELLVLVGETHASNRDGGSLSYEVVVCEADTQTFELLCGHMLVSEVTDDRYVSLQSAVESEGIVIVGFSSHIYLFGVVVVQDEYQSRLFIDVVRKIELSQDRHILHMTYCNYSLYSLTQDGRLVEYTFPLKL